jgi:hypothetical protein
MGDYINSDVAKPKNNSLHRRRCLMIAAWVIYYFLRTCTYCAHHLPLPPLPAFAAWATLLLVSAMPLPAWVLLGVGTSVFCSEETFHSRAPLPLPDLFWSAQAIRKANVIELIL